MDERGQGDDTSLLYSEETFRVRSAVFEVSRQLGTGFLEAVYQEALGLEFQAQAIPFVPTPALAISYKGRLLTQTYRPDFVCFERIVVELKVVRELAPEHRAQTLNYLKATGLRVGLLANFGCAPKARVERLVL
ncbi:MAG TPA: GxxExxY protein [Caulobacteraceae bacterium]|nr:GxxExxY protein [Caulobacteraceae bacterium]